MAGQGIKVHEVEKGSQAEKAGITPGDEILSVNQHRIPDELALKFYLAEELVQVQVRKVHGGEELLELDLSDGGGLGIRVEDFKTRTCNNACLFCFIDQLPPGARSTLQVKDDDYRLSFLHGNYITLTNLPEKELDRIIEQALSPLYVSVHATDPELRTRILGRRKVDDLDRKMRKLIEGGIRLNTQIVLMPEINDGKHLEKTVYDLYRYYPGVNSIAIVPLGLSDHGDAREHYVAVTAPYCRRIIREVSPWQERFRAEIDRTFAYLADEFYIQGGVPLPETDYYDDFAQIEDGVGMVRKFLNEFNSEMARWRKPRQQLCGTLVTARLFYPYLQQSIDRFNEKFVSRLKVQLVENRFMGKDITVAGLLAGSDIVTALRDRPLGDFVIIPSEAISRVDGILVDNMSPGHVSAHLGTPVYSSGSTVRDFFTLVSGLEDSTWGASKGHPQKK
jgi:putative radical SAM enzyme (TIGR03279 family)